MEFNLPIIITKWADGFKSKETGRVYYLHPIRREVRLITECNGGVVRVLMSDIVIVGVKVIEKSIMGSLHSSFKDMSIYGIILTYRTRYSKNPC
jgi:hypothetical protein